MHNNIVQQIQYFWHEYRVLNQIPGDGGLYDKQPPQCKMEIPGGWGASKVKVPSVGSMDIVSGTTQ